MADSRWRIIRRLLGLIVVLNVAFLGLAVVGILGETPISIWFGYFASGAFLVLVGISWMQFGLSKRRTEATLPEDETSNWPIVRLVLAMALLLILGSRGLGEPMGRPVAWVGLALLSLAIFGMACETLRDRRRRKSENGE